MISLVFGKVFFLEWNGVGSFRGLGVGGFYRRSGWGSGYLFYFGILVFGGV